jgi:hypothetical protein
MASCFLFYDPCPSKKLAGSNRSNLSLLMCQVKIGWSPWMTAKLGKFFDTREVSIGVYKIVLVDNMSWRVNYVSR